MAAALPSAVVVALAVLVMRKHRDRKPGGDSATMRLHLFACGLTLIPLLMAWTYSVLIRPTYLVGRYDLVAWPVHPTETEIEGVPCAQDPANLPEPVHGLSIITPPEVTETVVEAAAEAGIKRLWMQPGAESNEAISRAKDLGMSVIAGGPCLLVVLGYRE